MCKQYAYARISRKTQNIQRQIENITKAYPDARIYQEAFTGTKIEGRTEFKKMLSVAKTGDTIIFDSVSRMSRNADEGIALYEQLFNKGIELVFLKEQHINTSVYRETLQKQIDITVNTGDIATDTFLNDIIKALKKFQMDLAKKQILLAFEQAEKEVTDLHERTKEGMREAKRNGKQIGRATGTTVVTKKSIDVKKLIKVYSRDFDGSLNDKDTMVQIRGKLECTLSENSYYKYKREMREEIANG